MATQEEVLKVIVENGGYISFKQLKKHFNISQTGSSWLPQRIRSLEFKKLVYRLRIGNETFVIVDPDIIEFDFRGRPKGSISINLVMEQKLLKFVNDNKIVSWRQLRDNLGWDTKTLNKYVKILIEKNMLIEWYTGTIMLYMTPESLNDILSHYYQELYSNF